MTERLAYHPFRVTPAAGTPEGTAANSATASRSFADTLADAEAVQDRVQLRTQRTVMPTGRGSWNHLAGGALHAAMALLTRPAAVAGWVHENDKPRRPGARGESALDGEA
jgi:hypothetical protein